MGGSTIRSLTTESAEAYASREVSELIAENPEFFQWYEASELGHIALAAFNQANQGLLDAISQHAFDKALDFMKDKDMVKPYIALYRQSETYVEELANRGQL